MRDTIIKYTTKVDFFGQPISLKLNSEFSSKTLFGGILTLSFVFGFISIFYVLFLDYLQKTNPIISIENQVFSNRPEININKNTTSLAFGINDFYSNVIDMPNYFRLVAKILRVYNLAEGETIIRPLPIKLCKPDDFPKLDNDTFYNIPLNLMYCVENLNETIFGYWNEPIFQFIQLDVNYCINKTESDTCADVNEIKQFFKTGPYYFNIYFMDSAVNPKEYTTTISHNIVNKYKAFKGDTYKDSEVYFKKQTLMSDDGFISQEIQSTDTISFDFIEGDDSDIPDDFLLNSFEVMSSNNYVIYHRNYKKISYILSTMGGLSSIVIFLMESLCYFFSIHQKNEQILNKIFDFDLIEDKIIQNRNIVKETKFSVKMEKEKNLYNQTDLHQNISSNNFRNKFSLAYNEIQNLKQDKYNYLKETNPVQNTKTIVINENMFSSKNKYIKKLNWDDEGFTNKPLQYIRVSKANVLIKDGEIREQLKLNLHENDPQIIKKIMLEGSNYKYKISNLEIFMFSMCRICLNKKSTLKFILYRKSKDALNQMLDISNIIKQVEEFHKLKMILLSKEQIALYNFIAKDIISNDKTKSNANKINELKEFGRNTENIASVAVNYYEKIINEIITIGDIDKRLIESLNEKFKINISEENKYQLK